MRSRRPAPSELWSAAQAAAADAAMIDARAFPSALLMERASLAVAHEVRRFGRGQVWVVVGPGHNGGDGLATARILQGWGRSCHVVLAADVRTTLRPQLDWARASGVTIHEAAPVAPARGIVVDGLLGTGASGPLRGRVDEVLRWQRAIAGPRIAIDLPTGVDADTGEVAEGAFRADLTVTFVRSKPGLHITPGRDHAGDVVVADIGIDPRGVGAPSTGRVRLIGSDGVATTLAAMPPATHKGQRGHVMVIAGGRTTPGAAVLTATAAMRSWSGLCTLVGDVYGLGAQVSAARPELMVAAWDDDQVFARADALVVGPGLTDPDLYPRLEALYRDDPRPAVWDASALACVPFGVHPRGPRIVTPHPGEADRMGHRGHAPWTGSVQDRRRRTAQWLAEGTGAVVVLKGAGTLVATPSGDLWIAVAGSSALATAGSGDVLAGVLGALLARGLAPDAAAMVGVHVHAVAGDLANEDHRSPMAADIIDVLGTAAANPSAWSGRPWPRWRRG